VVNLHPTSARAGLFDREDPSLATALRTRQIAAATEAARRSKDPVLLAGDTNLPEGSLIARSYFAPFHDAFVDVGFGFGHTFPAKLPWMRIDRVLGGPRVRFLDVRVLPRGASDHRAVVVDFEIVPP
jgi:endonuclease/exonuclease/phosphatase (EEP) superfamily protein YafD